MPRKPDSAFGEYLFGKGMTQRELAAMLGISEVSVHNKATGRTPWKLHEARKLYEIFGKEIIDVLM